MHRDLDDENDASVVLRKVLGDPPGDVLYTRWVFDEEKNTNVLVTYPEQSGGIEIEMGGSRGEPNETETTTSSNKLA